MRVGVVDIGTNSTRLLVAEVRDGEIEEVDRRTTVTRLGEGVDASGALGRASIERVLAALDEYREAIIGHRCEATTAVLTSAVRDARNGAEFTRQVCERYGLDARTIDGETEARLTFRGATAQRDSAHHEPVLVVDVGGGSTELVVGEGEAVAFHVSNQTGVVRQSERHLHDDPAEPEQLQALAAEVAATVAAAVPAAVRRTTAAAIAVAGTATSAAAVDLELEPYDAARVEGHRLELGQLESLLTRLAIMRVAERREVVGLHPDRAPTIVAGLIILIEVLRLFDLDEVTISERDILWGAALELAERRPTGG